MKPATTASLLLAALLMQAAPHARAEVELIDSSRLASMMQQGAVVIDIRRQDEWRRTGVLADSHTVTFFNRYGAYNAEQWLAEVSPLLESGKPVVLICHSGARSGRVAQWLDSQAGIETLYDAGEGVAGWLGQGRPVNAYSE